jgi:hypothetical protein
MPVSNIANPKPDERAHVYSNSASRVLLVLPPLVPHQRLPAHPLAVLLQRPFPPSTLPQLPRHPQRPPLRRLPRRRRPLVVPVCSRRWQPRQAPLPSVRLSATAFHPCSLVAAPSLRQRSSSSKQFRSKTRLPLRRIVRCRPRISPSVSRRPTCKAAHGTLSSSRR